MTCARCAGTGCFQTYKGYSNSYKSAFAITNHTEYPELIEVIPQTKNKVAYDDDLIEWQNKDYILFDNREQVLKANKHSKLFVENLETLAGITPTEKLGRVHTSFETVPVTILDYKFENKDYTLFIVGDDNIICYADIPKKHSYKSGVFTRLKNAFTKKKRQIAFLHIASYMFNSDDVIADEEARLFETFLNKIKLDHDKRNILVEKLKNKNSFDSMISLIKCVKKDKRALVFAWHCVIEDNQVDEKEIKAFNDLCSYFKAKDSDIELIKHKAKQFRSLSSEQMLDEYFK